MRNEEVTREVAQAIRRRFSVLTESQSKQVAEVAVEAYESVPDPVRIWAARVADAATSYLDLWDADPTGANEDIRLARRTLREAISEPLPRPDESWIPIR